LTSSFTGCTRAPSPAESHTANRTHFFPAALNGIRNWRFPKAGNSVARTICRPVELPSPHTTSANFQRKRPFHVGHHGALIARSLNRPGQNQDFSGGHKVISALHRIDDRRPVIGTRPRTYFHIVHRIVGVYVVARALLIHLGDRLHVFGRRRQIRDPIVHIIEQGHATIVTEPLFGPVEPHSPAESHAAIIRVPKRRRILRCVRITSRSLRPRVRHEQDHVLATRHLHQIRRAAHVINLAVLRVVFHQRLSCGAALHPVHRMRNQQVMMPAETLGRRSAEDLFIRHHEKVLVRMQARRLVVICQSYFRSPAKIPISNPG
jgi:hypothetical protein